MSLAPVYRLAIHWFETSECINQVRWRITENNCNIWHTQKTLRQIVTCTHRPRNNVCNNHEETCFAVLLLSNKLQQNMWPKMTKKRKETEQSKIMWVWQRWKKHDKSKERNKAPHRPLLLKTLKWSRCKKFFFLREILGTNYCGITINYSSNWRYSSDSEAYPIPPLSPSPTPRLCSASQTHSDPEHWNKDNASWFLFSDTWHGWEFMLNSCVQSWSSNMRLYSYLHDCMRPARLWKKPTSFLSFK